MGRPITLIQESLLENMHTKYSFGVPVLKLIKEYNLEGSITPPTLAKLFSYVSALHNENTPKEVSATIYNSLYPKWLAKESKKVVSNPSSVVYVGKMPLGRWEVLN
ncbi:MAG: hypothetical protein COV55_02745 [Candidatus Komeilibacteria bacterium CG11_big_fil_rev_8_21_14_0_20_36_20]|uniref:Uncharacterized protein n=1 Tax=Candidatus Komeilibacteria bacterium CG11_big_fil_rev_8_21_14_0_20_36_20 TaxID=1974477 RepID=A0A2H0NCM6_9BACT|nr:MAG: hypothetical protein COV55_02745 [Candidatus Komeilibacteria bacterium CG11_big_fil_rev_8_21_14_0_20_36_20]